MGCYHVSLGTCAGAIGVKAGELFDWWQVSYILVKVLCVCNI